MAALNTDILPIKRGEQHYRTTVGDLLALVEGTIVVDDLLSSSSTAALSANAGRTLSEKIDALGTSEHMAANIAVRDALTGLVIGDKVEVNDASGDPDVTSGWAIYRVNGVGPTSFRRIAEQESLDVVQAPTNLSIVPSATGVDSVSSTGTGASLALASAAAAGLMSPAQVQSILDVAAASHAAVTVAAGNTPLAIVGQEISFDIGALPPAP